MESGVLECLSSETPITPVLHYSSTPYFRARDLP